MLNGASLVMRLEVELPRLVADRVRFESELLVLGKGHLGHGASHPATAQHVEAEGSAKAVDPKVLFGEGEAHPRPSVSKPSAATMQRIGGVSDVENLFILIANLCLLPPRRRACGQQRRQKNQDDGSHFTFISLIMLVISSSIH